jgi:hypothetical protein
VKPAKIKLVHEPEPVELLAVARVGEFVAAWLAFVVEHFLDRWGYAVRGAVAWQGETDGDKGVLVVLNNRLIVAGSGHNHCADGPVGDDMLFAGGLAKKLEAAARLGGAVAVMDLLDSRACRLRP